VLDKISFLLNNLSSTNLEAKARELRERIGPSFLPWFANDMVVRRAAQEPNHHRLYVALLEAMGDRELARLLVNTTHHYVRIMLDSDRIVSSANERSLLKNLGTWLGLLTFAKNRPLLQRQLDVKATIVLAYQRAGRPSCGPFGRRAR